MKLAACLRPAIAIDISLGEEYPQYAQLVRELTGKPCLYDRDEELWIAQDAALLQDIRHVVEQYALPYEPVQLLELPGNSTLGLHADDYGFTSQSARTYLYADHIYAFRLCGGEAAQARYQIEEYALAAIPYKTTIWIVPAEHSDLMPGIAKAYGCMLESALP